MRIDAYNQVTQIYNTSNKLKAQKTAKDSKLDKVEISEFGKVYQTAKNAVNEASDIREDKIADIKNRIQSGTYDVSPEAFADKMLANYEGAF